MWYSCLSLALSSRRMISSIMSVLPPLVHVPRHAQKGADSIIVKSMQRVCEADDHPLSVKSNHIRHLRVLG